MNSAMSSWGASQWERCLDALQAHPIELCRVRYKGSVRGFGAWMVLW